MNYCQIFFCDFGNLWIRGDRAVLVDCIIRMVHAIADGDGPKRPKLRKRVDAEFQG